MMCFQQVALRAGLQLLGKTGIVAEYISVIVVVEVPVHHGRAHCVNMGLARW